MTFGFFQRVIDILFSGILRRHVHLHRGDQSITSRELESIMRPATASGEAESPNAPHADAGAGNIATAASAPSAYKSLPHRLFNAQISGGVFARNGRHRDAVRDKNMFTATRHRLPR